MPDFNSGINPFGVPFNPNRKAKQDQEAETTESPAATPHDPYASSKVSPEQVYNLLSAQSGMALRNVSVDNMERLMHAPTGLVSPEEHAKVTNQFRDSYRKEFGSNPSAELLSEMVDDYLIGQVIITQSA
jgi:hypothetical protein